jgi:Domain of unknown function (DUF5666)
MRKFILAGAGVALLALPALAQAPAGGPPKGTPARVRGTVDSLTGNTLTVKDKAGQTTTINLAPNYAVRAVAKRNLSDIKDGDFLASVSTKGTDGKLHATEVTIFPDALKGVVPQLQAPWDYPSDSLMTNAIVTGTASAPDGQSIKMKYKDTDTEIVVAPDAPVVAMVSGDPSLLKSGAYVVVMGLKQADGTVNATNVTAEKDGVKPPM